MTKSTSSVIVSLMVVVALTVTGLPMGGGTAAYAAQARQSLGPEWVRETAMASWGMIVTADNGFVVAGDDYGLAKYDSAGKWKWKNNYNNSAGGTFSSVAQAADGGYFATGYAGEDDEDSDRNANQNFLVARFDANGNCKWFKTYSGNNNDRFNGVTNAVDGGFVAVGGSASATGIVPGNNGYEDCVIAKFDADGDPQWMKNVGGKRDEEFYEVIQSGDGGYVAVGSSSSPDGDFTTTRQGENCIIAKFDADGNKLWTHVLGSSGDDSFSSITAGVDGGYVAAGQAGRCDGDFAGGEQDGNLLLVKYDEAGNCLWIEKGNDADSTFIDCIRPSNDGGYIAAGGKISRDGDSDGWDGLAAKFDRNGKRIWLKTYGISDNNYFTDVVPSADGGYVVACRNDGDSIASSSEMDAATEEEGGDYANFIAKIPETPTTIKTMADKAYTGKAIKPNPVVQMGDNRLVKDRDYSIKYRYNKNIGVAEVTITGKGDYYGTLYTSFKINPRKVALKSLKAAKGQLAVAWKKTKAAQKITNYQIRYRQVGVKKWKVKKVTPEKAAYTINGLKKGKRYQVQIRSYKNIYWDEDYDDEEYDSYDRYYSAWSTVKTSAKIK